MGAVALLPWQWDRVGTMTDRAERIRRELRALTVEAADTATILIQPTKAQSTAVAETASEVDVKPIIGEVAIVIAERFAEAIEQQGMRPADYWRMTAAPETLAKRIGKALSEAPPEFLTAFQATLKGRG